MPPSRRASRRPGGNAGAGPSRSRRAIAERAWGTWPREPLRGARPTATPSAGRRERARAPRRRQRGAGWRADDELGVAAPRARAGAARASRAPATRAAASTRGREHVQLARAGPADEVAAAGGRGQPPRHRQVGLRRASSWAAEPCTTTATSLGHRGEALAPGARACPRAARARRRRPRRRRARGGRRSAGSAVSDQGKPLSLADGSGGPGSRRPAGRSGRLIQWISGWVTPPSGRKLTASKHVLVAGCRLGSVVVGR